MSLNATDRIVLSVVRAAVVSIAVSLAFLLLTSGFGGSLGRAVRCELARGDWQINYPLGPIECVDWLVEPFDVASTSSASAQILFLWVPLAAGGLVGLLRWRKLQRHAVI